LGRRDHAVGSVVGAGIHFGEEVAEIERAGEHVKVSIGGHRPLYARPVPVKFDAIFVGIPQVKRLAHAVIGRSIKSNSRAPEPPQRIGQCRALRVKDRQMKQPGAAARRRRTAQAFPRVQADVVMVAASGNEGRTSAVALRQLEPQHAAVKLKSALQIGHLEMDVADADFRVDGRDVRHLGGRFKQQTGTAASDFMKPVVVDLLGGAAASLLLQAADFAKLPAKHDLADQFCTG
jgi:hypothetical protein